MVVYGEECGGGDRFDGIVGRTGKGKGGRTVET